MSKDEIFKLTQGFLKPPPVIIWGSGAVIPYGLPSMDTLKQKLSGTIEQFDNSANLEVELSKIQDKAIIDKAKKVIREEICKKDLKCLERSIHDSNYFIAIKKMINKWTKPILYEKLDIITTNYDRILEYSLSQYDRNYTDGFSGKQLSVFNRASFKNKNIVNLIKIHGSLNWFKLNGKAFFLHSYPQNEEVESLMIPPTNEKYKEVQELPYVDLTQRLYSVIDKAKSFFVVGFGFNDTHLTPKIEEKIGGGTSIVIITKCVTLSCKEKLKNAKNYCLFEEGENEEDGTKVTLKVNNKNGIETTLEKSYWKLDKFFEDIL